VGALLLLFVPRENEDVHRVVGNLFGALGFLVFCRGALVQSRTWADFNLEEMRMDYRRSARNIISALTASAFAGHAHTFWASIAHPFLLERDQAAPEGILHSAFAPPDGHDRRFRLAGFFFLFYVFWEVMPRAHVLLDRRVGQRPAPLRGHQVFPLHAGRFRS